MTRDAHSARLALSCDATTSVRGAQLSFTVTCSSIDRYMLNAGRGRTRALSQLQGASRRAARAVCERTCSNSYAMILCTLLLHTPSRTVFVGTVELREPNALAEGVTQQREREAMVLPLSRGWWCRAGAVLSYTLGVACLAAGEAAAATASTPQLYDESRALLNEDFDNVPTLTDDVGPWQVVALVFMGLCL
jgi:hypothetical protein